MLSFQKSRQTDKDQAAPCTDKQRFQNFWCHAAALIFALFMVFGRSFEKTDSWGLIIGSATDCLLSLVQGVCWYLVFYIAIFYLYRFLDETSVSSEPAHAHDKKNSGLIRAAGRLARMYMTLLRQHPVRTVFCTMMIVNIPYMVLSYPAIFMGDTGYQISQGFNEAGLTNHHPVVHTLFLSLFLRIGEMIGSCNIGIFLYCLVQTVFLCAVIAYAVGALVEIKANNVLTVGIVLYYCIHPRISSYLFLVAKDVFYSAFLTLFYILLFKLIQSGLLKRKWDYAVFALSIIGVTVFRNDGKYVIIFTLLIALFYKKFRWAAFSYLVLAVLTSAGLSEILFPLLDVEPGSVREMLSVPFQQTARYVRDAGDDLSDSEIEIIDHVLDYESLASSYDPDISDPVKGTYHGTPEDLKEYFGVWFQMLLRHPGIYVQATMNNYYQYFYPGQTSLNYFSYGWGEYKMEELNKSLQTDYHLPKNLNDARNSFEMLREDIFNLPLLFLLKSPAFYIWAALLFLCYCLRRKCLPGIIYCAPMFVQLLIFITGPTNGYYCRYEYPMLIYLPVVLVLGLKLLENHSHPYTAPDQAR